MNKFCETCEQTRSSSADYCYRCGTALADDEPESNECGSVSESAHYAALGVWYE